MNWACKYIKQSDRMMVVWPVELTKFNEGDSLEPLNAKCQKYLNDKYHPLEGDVFSYPFVTYDFAPYLAG